jgi:hypothetical protein
MMFGLARGLRKWGVITAGLLLVVCGGSAMWTGWDQILIERGWSLFIAGATLIAGGAITASIGIMLAHFDAWAKKNVAVSVVAGSPLTMAPAATQSASADQPAEITPSFAAPGETGSVSPKTSDEASEPAIIDRYESSGAAYVMFSDGSVEVRTEFGTQRYASVAELRADMDP